MFAGNGDSAKWMKEILRFAREPGQLPTSRRRYEERMAIPRFGNRTSSQLAGASHSVNDQNSRWFSDRGTRVAQIVGSGKERRGRNRNHELSLSATTEEPRPVVNASGAKGQTVKTERFNPRP